VVVVLRLLHGVAVEVAVEVVLLQIAAADGLAVLVVLVAVVQVLFSLKVKHHVRLLFVL
jgi:hypothetical protein